MLRLAFLSVAVAILGLGRGGAATPGGWIVFDAGRGEGGANLALVRPDGTGFHLLTHGDETASAVTWTADDRLAVDFQDVAGDNETLWTMSSDGSSRTLVRAPVGPHEVASAPGDVGLVVSTEYGVLDAVDLQTGAVRAIGQRASSPAFAPNGELYTVVDAQPSDGWVAVRSTVDGRDRRLMRGFTVSVSPDGRSIAVVRGDWLWIANADGSGARRVVPVDSADTTWSPDSRSVAFFCRKGQGVRVCTVPSAGTATVHVARVEDAHYAALSWSRRGLVFRAGLGRKTGIWTWNGVGTPTLVLRTDAEMPSWSPDGTRIAFLRVFPEEPGGPPLAAVDVVDPHGHVRQITHPAVDSAPIAPPSGKWIYFWRDRISGTHSIVRRYAIRPDGTGLHLAHQGGWLVWTQNGTLMYAVQNGRRIDLRTADGKLVRSYALPRQDEPQFDVDALLPDGDLGISYSSDESTCGVAILTSPGPPRFLRPTCPDTDITYWTSDGSHVAGGIQGRVWTANVVGGPLTTIVRLGPDDFATTAWSSGGGFLAVSIEHDPDAAVGGASSDLALFDATGHRIRTIVPRAIGAHDPIWINP